MLVLPEGLLGLNPISEIDNIPMVNKHAQQQTVFFINVKISFLRECIPGSKYSKPLKPSNCLSVRAKQSCTRELRFYLIINNTKFSRGKIHYNST